MLPHIVYHTSSSDYFPDPDFWQTASSPQSASFATSGITQPPLITSAALAICACLPPSDAQIFAQEVFPPLLAYHRWFFRERDATREGLVAIVHPWESGTDNSPRWRWPLSAIIPHHLPPYRRADAVHVLPEERPTQEEYDRYIYLIDLFRRLRYDQEAILAQSPFQIQDVLVNALLYRATEDLRTLALRLGQSTEEMDAWLARLRVAFHEKLWDPVMGLYRDYDLRTGRPIPANSVVTFVPLFAGLADEEQAQRLVRDHLLNPREYAPGSGLAYYVSSVSRSEPGWDPRRYWCGPIWININWLVIHGLRRYGYDDLAETIRQHTLGLIAREGFREYYDPRTGSGLGSRDFSWSAALFFDLTS